MVTVRAFSVVSSETGEYRASSESSACRASSASGACCASGSYPIALMLP